MRSPVGSGRRSFLEMCLICIDFDRGALNVQEARRAFREMRAALPEEHASAVEAKLKEAAAREAETSSDQP